MKIKGDYIIWHSFCYLTRKAIKAAVKEQPELLSWVKETYKDDKEEYLASVLTRAFLSDFPYASEIKAENIGLNDLEKQQIKRKYGKIDNDTIVLFALGEMGKGIVERRYREEREPEPLKLVINKTKRSDSV